MNAMTDDAMALTVVEATMQDFLTARQIAELSPLPAASMWSPPAHVVIEAPQPRRQNLPRPAARGRTAPVPAARARSKLQPQPRAAVRGVYWIGLLAAVALVVLV
jgi:hypothetical protein